MVIASISLLLLGAVFGVALALKIFQEQTPTLVIAVIHGIAAATGLLIAVLAALQPDAASSVKAGASLLIVAALGGFVLLSSHFRGVRHSKPLVVVHAAVAVSGVGSLAYSLL